jgi:undecaprenyl-diphosphatase
MARGVLDFAQGERESDGARLGAYVILSSVPVILAGLVLHKIAPEFLRSIEVMAWATLLFGIVLWWVDERAPQTRTVQTLNMRDALYIGCAQMLALIPGTSRSGITMTAARYLGFDRISAARYSLLLAIIAISGAGMLTGKDLLYSGDLSLGLDVLVAAFLAFISGLLAIKIMMAWLEHASFKVFGIYRIILGTFLLALIYSGLL